MKILHVIFRMRMGGTECMLVDIIGRQVRAGHDVALMVINSGSDPALLSLLPAQARLFEIGRAGGSFSPLKVLEANFVALRFKPDIVHVHNKRIVNMLMLPSLRRRMIQTLHTTGIDLTGPQLHTGFTAISQAVADDARCRLGLEMPVVANGIDFDAVMPRRQAPERIASLVCVGRLDSQVKGQDLAVRAMADPRLASMTLTLIGDGPDLESLRRLARSLGVESRVFFAGAMSRGDVYAALARFDLFILPSRVEGFGLALAEGMAAGIPVVTAALPGPLEITLGDNFGRPFNSGSSVSLADAVASVAQMPPSRIAAMCDGARRRVMSRFSIDSTVSAYTDAYHSLIPSARK